MIKTSLFGLLVAASTAVMAQTAPAPAPTPGPPTTTPSGTQPATPATPAQPADTASDTTAVPATPATPAAPATTEPATDPAAPNAGTVQSTVDAEWASYDTNNNSQLSRAEFTKWVTALQSASGGKAPTRSYLTSAFQKADADKSGGVSKAELVTFLGS